MNLLHVIAGTQRVFGRSGVSVLAAREVAWLNQEPSHCQALPNQHQIHSFSVCYSIKNNHLRVNRCQLAPQLRIGGCLWCNILMPTCPCWWHYHIWIRETMVKFSPALPIPSPYHRCRGESKALSSTISV